MVSAAQDRLTILVNSNLSRGKAAAAAVHAALAHYGIDHGAVIVLGSNPGKIDRDCTSVIRDAGRTEVTPGTVTAGVRDHLDVCRACQYGSEGKFDGAAGTTHTCEKKD